jgi:hypothetical protein
VPEVVPKVTLRLGSHAEKDYVEKTLKQFDGVIVGANLLEASPAATASLLLKFHNKTKRPYYVDPMTYAFGAYVDPETEDVRHDLDWIKSDQKIRGQKDRFKRDFKSSYKSLADAFGPPFSTAVERSTAIGQKDFASNQLVDNVCQRILRYQNERLRDEFREDSDTAAFADDLPSPAVLFAPYFYVEESRAEEWIDLNHRLALSSAKQAGNVPVHVIVCCHRDALTDAKLSATLIKNILECKPAGAWLWFSRFDEHLASARELSALRSWVEQLAPTVPVFNMHGGFFSLALSRLGMRGIAHGVGYGEQKDVVPVIGQSTPTVQYYVRSLHSKYSVVQITRSFTALKIRTPEDFFKKICDCVICKGVIGKDLNAFARFGDIHYSTPASKRASQTPAAAKRCRFHFLLNRIKERDYVSQTSLPDIAADCLNSYEAWSKTFLERYTGHLKLWNAALS